MGLKPLDKSSESRTKEKPKKPVSLARIAIIGVVIVVGLLFSKLLILKPIKIANSKEVKKTPDASAFVSDVTKAANTYIASAQKYSSSLMGEILGEKTQNLTKVVNKPQEAVSDYLFEQTVASILTQIQKLPKHQQEIIEEHICK